MPLGYDPRYGGLAVLPDGTCWQDGLQVSCEDETPVYVAPPQPYVSPKDSAGGGVTGGPKCAPGWIVRNGICVLAVQPPGPIQGGPKPPQPVPVFQPPIRIEPPTPTPAPSSGPVWWGRPRRMPRPVVRRAYKPRLAPKTAPSTPAGELCPIVGYVRRPIPGVAEEQIFRCDPGRPVVIDPGIREAGRAEAAARYGLHGLDGLFDGGDNTWLWIAGAVAVYYFFIRKAR